VLVLRIIAATDMAARAAEAQMHPGIARFEAFLATVCVRLIRFHHSQVGAAGGHRKHSC